MDKRDQPEIRVRYILTVILTFSLKVKLKAPVIHRTVGDKSNKHNIAGREHAERLQLSTILPKGTVLGGWAIVDFNVIVARCCFTKYTKC